MPALGAEYVYALTTHGAVTLEEIEQRFSLSLSADRNQGEDLSVIHSVELNNIELRVAKPGCWHDGSRKQKSARRTH